MKEYLIAFAKNLWVIFIFFTVALAITVVFMKYGLDAGFVCLLIVIAAGKSYLDVKW
jgi:hypothetical protein